MKKTITKYEYDEKGRLVKRTRNNDMVETTTYEEKPDGGYIESVYNNDELKFKYIYDNNSKLIETDIVFAHHKRLYEYDEKGRLIKERLYIGDELENEYTSTYDDINNTETVVSNNFTVFAQYDEDGDLVSEKEYINPKPYISNITEENISSICEYIYNDDDGTRCTMVYKDYNGNITGRNESEYFFSTIANKYLCTKMVETSSLVTRTIFYKYNDKDQLIEEKEISDYSTVLEG